MLSLSLFCRKNPGFNFLWLVDRLCIGVAFAGGLIRLGNFFNSEIVGKPTDLPWGVVFGRVDQLTRHPAQLYESFTYFLIFGILYKLFWNDRYRGSRGFLFGIFLILVFGFRFLIEFAKENQVAFESQLPIDMGQILSIPLVLIGVWLASRALRVGVSPPIPLAHGGAEPAGLKKRKFDKLANP